MKSLLSKLGATFLVIGLAAFLGTEAWGVNWKYYGTNEEGTYYYDTQTLTRLSRSNIRVCVQSIYTEKGVSHWVKEGGKGFQNLDFSLILSEYNCIGRSVRHLRIRFYSKEGAVFYPIKNDEWQLFAPDAMAGALFEEICKQ
ncbi:MAG: surface-adhesin E family protein [Thermodesulfobacteriota bacterium]